MKLKFKYSVEIFECHYSVENEQIYDDGYCSLDESQSADTIMHKKEEIKYCDKRVLLKMCTRKLFRVTG